MPVTYLHQVRGSQPIQNDTRYQPLKDSLLLHGLSFYGVIPTQRLEVWTDNASRSQISDNKRAQDFFFNLFFCFNKAFLTFTYKIEIKKEEKKREKDTYMHSLVQYKQKNIKLNTHTKLLQQYSYLVCKLPWHHFKTNHGN